MRCARRRARAAQSVGAARADRPLDRRHRGGRPRRRRFPGLARRADRARPGQCAGRPARRMHPFGLPAFPPLLCREERARGAPRPPRRRQPRAGHGAGRVGRARRRARVPTRYVFDEGHHLLEAADSAFSVRLSGQEGRELRRWLLGAEAGRSRARGLQRRIGDLVEADDEAGPALIEALVAARILPADGWHQRVADGRGLRGVRGLSRAGAPPGAGAGGEWRPGLRHRGRGAAADRRPRRGRRPARRRARPARGGAAPPLGLSAPSARGSRKPARARPAPAPRRDDPRARPPRRHAARRVERAVARSRRGAAPRNRRVARARPRRRRRNRCRGQPQLDRSRHPVCRGGGDAGAWHRRDLGDPDRRRGRPGDRLERRGSRHRAAPSAGKPGGRPHRLAVRLPGADPHLHRHRHSARRYRPGRRRLRGADDRRQGRRARPLHRDRAAARGA